MTITTWWMLMAALAVVSAAPITRLRDGRGYPVGLSAANAAALVAIAVSFPSGPANGALAPLWALVAVGCIPIVVDSLLDGRRSVATSGNGERGASDEETNQAATNAATNAATTCNTTIIG